MSQRSSDAHADRVAEPEKILRIAPNCSLTPYQARIFLGSLVAGTALVSGGIALQGYWLVLPFAGIEILAIYAALHLSMQRGRYQEVLRFTESQVVIEKGAQKIQERVEFSRYWATVTLIPSKLSSHPSRLLVGCKGQQLEIAACLTDTERESLARRLKQWIGPVESAPPLSPATA